MVRRRSGAWAVAGPPNWAGKYYQYEVRVFCPWTGRLETSAASDPYARALAADGGRACLHDVAAGASEL